MTNHFHNVSFPVSIALGAIGGPTRKTDIISLTNGHEQRISRWKHSRRRYNAGVAVKNRADLEKILHFFEERQGRLYSFRWRDPVDHSSATPGNSVTPFDQSLTPIENSDGDHQLIKSYGTGPSEYQRTITKPQSGTVVVAVDGSILGPSEYEVDDISGAVSFATVPPDSADVTAGFYFDVPVRFEHDEMMIDLVSFTAGQIPDIPIIEVLEP